MTEAGSTGDDIDHREVAGEWHGQYRTPGAPGPANPGEAGDTAAPGPVRNGKVPDDWESYHGWAPEPRRRLGRAWLFTGFAATVVALTAAVTVLIVGDPPVTPVDPIRLAAPVTLPGQRRTPTPPPRPSDTAQAVVEVCPGSDQVSADDQPGWQHATVSGPGVPCAGRYSLHTTSTGGGVFYRWTVDVTQPGHCDLAVYVPDTPQADVDLVHYTVLDDGAVVEGFVIAQAKDHGQLVPAGTYPTRGTGPLTVQMDSRSPVPGTVVASAVRFACHPG